MARKKSKAGNYYEKEMGWGKRGGRGRKRKKGRGGRGGRGGKGRMMKRKRRKLGEGYGREGKGK